MRIIYSTIKKPVMKKSVIAPLQFLAFFLSCSMLLMACNSSTTTSEENKTDTSKAEKAPMAKAAEAMISGTKSDTTVAGKATFTEENGSVKMDLEVTAPQLANKSVAVHLHMHGDCGNSGNNSHGHWNPANKPHGKWGEGDFHAGDIGNVSLDATGKGTYSLTSTIWSIGGDSTTNIVGKAIIVHSGVDDYKTQPTGNAGTRIGCGVIEEKK
jgi:Cu-Zn family superoxide dismutase